MTDPEGTDLIDYDDLYRVIRVTRQVTGHSDVIETYGYNAMGALVTNASETTGITLDDQRPRIGASGTAPSAVMAKLNGVAVGLDPVGRITSLNGATIAWDKAGLLASITNGASVETYRYDARKLRVGREPSTGASEYFVYEGDNIVARLDPTGGVSDTYLYDGIDHPLRLTRGGFTYFYELDLAGNVRRLRGPGGTDGGGYRYTAYGMLEASDSGTPLPSLDQALRWKGRWFVNQLGGVYDVRARWWSPALGSFLSIDEFEFEDPNTTLWGWPGQAPYRLRDSSGHGPTCALKCSPASCENRCAGIGQRVVQNCFAEYAKGTVRDPRTGKLSDPDAVQHLIDCVYDTLSRYDLCVAACNGQAPPVFAPKACQ